MLENTISTMYNGMYAINHEPQCWCIIEMFVRHQDKQITQSSVTLRYLSLFFEHLASPMPSKTIKNGFLVNFCVDIGPRGSTGAPDGSEC